MKVILTHNHTKHYSGGSKYFYLLAKHLTEQGIEVEFVLDSIEGETKLREICPSIECKVVKPSHTILFSLALANYLRGRKFDILHTSHIFPYFYLHLRNRRPVIFQPFGSGFFTLWGTNLGSWKLGQHMQEFCGNKADATAAEADWQIEEITRFYKIGKDKIFVLPVGVDIPYTKNKDKLSREDLNLPSNTFIILSVNALFVYKGMDILIEAFRLANLPNSKLIMIGQGPEETRINKLIKNYGLENKVLHLKEIPENRLYSYYSISDLYISLSAEKDMEMGILEAEVFGLPIISSKSWLIDGNGYAVVSRNPVEAAEALSRVHNENKEKMRKRSKELVQEFDFKHIAERAIAQYKKVLYGGKTDE